MSGHIEQRWGAEVYLGSEGHVVIKQVAPGMDENLIILHHEEVPDLIRLLEECRQEALDFVPEERAQQSDEPNGR